MSLRAMQAAMQSRGLGPTAKLILVALADRHNDDTRACHPSQARLAADAEVSRATLNRHLKTLEECGEIVRVERIDGNTGKQLSTFYILSIDFDDPPDIAHATTDYRAKIDAVRVSNCDTENRVSKSAETVSQNHADPCLKMRHKPGIEPGKEPNAHARARKGARERERDLADQLFAQAIKDTEPWCQTVLSAVRVRELLAAGLVTESECRAAGVLPRATVP